MSAGIDLGGQWRLGCPEWEGRTIPAESPGDNYSALLAAGEILATAILRLGGASAGKEVIPAESLDRLRDYPYSVVSLHRLATQLPRFSIGVPASVVPAAYWAIPLRNLVFNIAVLNHMVRRGFLFCLGR